MPWLTDLASLLGPAGAVTNASRSEELAAEDEVERFLQRLAHPAGRAAVPIEPPAG